jgi:pimeloyl-ACP methyl ester carboxylesterase
MSEASVIIDGVRSPLLEFGSPGLDEAVVFVHGNPGSSLDWERLARGVGEFGRAVAMDMPGFGAADKPADFDYSVPGYARFLGRLLAERRVQRAHLVMHNFGGPWGLAWAAANPEAILSVTCINTGVLSGYRWHYLARIWQTPANCLWLPRRRRGCACYYGMEIPAGFQRNITTMYIKPSIAVHGERR